MSNGENYYNNLSRSISKQSQYSDALENYEEVIRYSNANNIIEEKNSKKKLILFEDEDSFKIKKDKLYNFPEDNNEKDVLNLFKRKTNHINNTESENNLIINTNDLNNINDNLNINNINNEKYNEINSLEENLYSEHDNDESIKNNNSKLLLSEKNPNKEIKVTKLKKIEKDNKINFDFNLEPLDTVSINTDKDINKNKKSKKKIKKTFKKLLTFNKKSLDEKENGSVFQKKISSNIGLRFSHKFYKNKIRTRSIYDPNNILRKAVIMNGRKSINLNYSIKDESSIEQNIEFNEKQLSINNIKFNQIRIDELDTNHLKKFLRIIEVESERDDSHKNFFKTLIELQNFYIDNSSVWVIKLDKEGKYLAGGCKSGKIKIHEIIGYNYSGFKTVYEPHDIIDYLHFISETPYKTLEKHKADIIDLDWSPHFSNLLLSASLDHLVCLWDISKDQNCLIKVYEHNDIVTSVNFNPFFQNVFMSGCLEHFVHIWKFDLNEGLNLNNIDYNKVYISGIYNNYSLNRNEKNSLKDDKDVNISIGEIDKTNANLETQNKEDHLDYFNIQHKITAVAFFPDYPKIAVGSEKGKIFVYNAVPKISYSHNFYVAKKHFGVFHKGKKVTNIQFIDKNYALITTADSVIRYVHMNTGRIIRQYYGYSNEYSMTRAYADLADDAIIIGGEDGKCYVWKMYEQIREEKNKIYECFKPFAKETIECSIIAHEECYINYMQKILKLTNKILILNIIINGTSNGRLEILLNIKEE